MIRCSHCGKLAPSGALSCQNCGMPLASGGAGVAGAGQSEQQELPAWLESLRGAHERPVSSGQENRQPFSLDELVDEDSMPSWMRQDRQKMPESGNSDSLPAIPATSAGTGAGGQTGPTSGFQAASLIDERSLPAWMRENQGQNGGQPQAAQNVSANSLVDQQGLPSWMKSLDQSAQTQTQAPAANHYGLPAPAQTSPMNSYGLSVQAPVTPPAVPSAPRVPQTPPASEPPAGLSQGFSAHDLLDAQSMPSWMSGSQGPGQSPGLQPPTRPVPTSQGFSAGELIDQRSVPEWMRNLQGQEKADPQSAMGVPVSGSGQMTGTNQGLQGTVSTEGMPASSLLDQNSMPSWMREGQQGNTPTPQATGQGMSAGSLLDQNSMPSWMREGQLASGAQPSQPSGQGIAAGSLFDANPAPSWMSASDQNSAQAPQSATGQGMSAGSLIDMGAMPAWMQENQQGQSASGQGMSAGSLIDMSAMPAWMRNADTNSAASGAVGRPGQAAARPVPSRPRGEAVQQEQSEVAANVFASMLGVAASAPALPGQEAMSATTLGVAQGQPVPPMPPVHPMQSAPQAPPSLTGWQQPPMNQYNQGAQPQAWQMSGAMPTLNPAQNAYPPMGQMAPGAGAGNWAQNANAPEQPAWGGYPPAMAPGAGMGNDANAGKAYPGNAQAPETKKKSFLDSIRDFFHH